MLRDSLRAVDGDAICLAGLVVCGAAGAAVTAKRDPAAGSTALDAPLEALRAALEAAGRLRAGGETPLHVLWHYPPFDAHGVPGPCVELLEKWNATTCVYGHLHRQREWSAAVHGRRGGVRYYCVAADALGFSPLRID